MESLEVSFDEGWGRKIEHVSWLFNKFSTQLGVLVAKGIIKHQSLLNMQLFLLVKNVFYVFITRIIQFLATAILLVLWIDHIEVICAGRLFEGQTLAKLG